MLKVTAVATLHFVTICRAQILKVLSASTVALASDTLELPQLSAQVGKLERLAMNPSRITWKSMLRSASQLCCQNLRRLKNCSSRGSVSLSPLCKKGAVSG